MKKRIAAIGMRVQIDVIDADNRITGREVSQEIQIYEADLASLPELLDYLKSRGLDLGEKSS